MPTTLTAAQRTQLEGDIANATGDYSTAYSDLNSFIAADGITLDSGTAYWYQQAQFINSANPQPGHPSRYFIRDVTEYGERLNHHSTGNTQAISNDIAHSVLSEIADTGVVSSLPVLLGHDISEAFSGYGVDIGGWGGSFYYWTSQPVLPNGTVESAVGVQIAASLTPSQHYDGGGLFDEFLAVNGAGIADTLATGITGIATTLANGVASIVGAGASLPTYLGFELVGRALQDEMGAAIVGSPNTIDGDVYQGGHWYYLQPDYSGLGVGPTLLDVGASESSALNQERAYRLQHQDIRSGSNSDLNPALHGPLAHLAADADPSAPADVSVSVGADGSYSSVSLTDSFDNSGQLISTEQHNAAGGMVLSTTSQFGDDTSTVDLWDGNQSIVASEDFFSLTEGQPASLQILSLYSQGASWDSSTIDFIAGTHDTESVIVDYQDGSWMGYNPTANGGWNEDFYDSSFNETKNISYSQVWDQAQGAYVFQTSVTDYLAGTTTVYAAGDPNAPGVNMPEGVASDYASAQQIWATLFADASSGGGAAGAAVSSYSLTGSPGAASGYEDAYAHVAQQNALLQQHYDHFGLFA